MFALFSLATEYAYSVKNPMPVHLEEYEGCTMFNYYRRLGVFGGYAFLLSTTWY